MKHKQQEQKQPQVIQPAPAHQPWAEVCPDCGHDMWFDNHSHKWACAYMFCPSVKIVPGVKWSRK